MRSRATLSRRQAIAAAGLAAIAGPARAALALPARGRLQFAPADVPEGFLLDGKPFQLRSGEMHPARIPRAYWPHRVRMAKAMGLNTIALYVMWSHHESEPGRFDFATGNRDIAAFIRLCAVEGMLVYLRPGPYVCGEWDMGGLPPYLLRNPDIRLRQLADRAYMTACERYVGRLATLVRPLMSDRGGPIAMVQVENEYASFGDDPAYLPAIRKMWERHGVRGPFSISDGLKQIEKAGTYLPGTALGLDGDTDFAAARAISRGAPVWVGEGYPGWITHWGDPRFATGDYRETLRALMRQRVSFNLYVVHGGTNFGFTAGANAANDGSRFEPTITSYDYGAPIAENGAPTEQYHALRDIIASATGSAPIRIPPTPRLVGFEPVRTRPVGSLWNLLPPPVATERPQPMEILLGQSYGMVLYRHALHSSGGGTLRIPGLRDEALLRLDGRPIGFLSRVAAARAPESVTIPPDRTGRPRQLDILVFPYGRVNFGRYLEDRKGILGDVTLAGDALLGWQAFSLPLDGQHLEWIRSAPAEPGGLLHEAEFHLDRVGDTFLDMAGWRLGFTWVNGNLLGRHSALGPQTRLYCPAPWLKRGRNRVSVLDLYAQPGRSVAGAMQRIADAPRAARTTVG